MWSFFRIVVPAFVEKRWLFVVLNWLFFGIIFVGVLLGEAGLFGFPLVPFTDNFFAIGEGGWVFTLSYVFIFNLVVSGFVLVTLSGILFFGLPVGFLLFRGFLWGVLLAGLPTPLFLVALPIVVLEGEGYVLACVAGVNLGLSWLSPRRAYGEGLSREESFKRALKDCVRIYVLVVVFLFVAAVVETLTVSFF